MYTYCINAIIAKKNRFISETVTTDSFVGAASELFRRHSECIDEIFDIYCRKPKSGDLALMAHYDGQTYRYNGTTQKKYIMTTKNGGKYVWDGNAFRMDDES